MDWNSNWIWICNWENRNQKVPLIVYFRKRFWIKEDNACACPAKEKAYLRDVYNLKISANCRYKLYINGVFVQEGPQKGTAEQAYVDPAEIREYLLPGENIAAVEVLYYPETGSGRNDSLYYSPYPCLFIEDLSEEKQLDGKNGWKAYPADHIQVTGEPFIPAPIHGSEQATGRMELLGWKKAGYEDSWWQDACPYSWLETTKPIAPFDLKKRTIPPMRHETCTFREVVCVRESAAQTAESLKEQWEYLFRGERPVEIPANTTQIVELSAGEEMCGYPTISFAGGKDAEIEILYSEGYAIPQPGPESPGDAYPLPSVKKDRTDWKNGTLLGTVDHYQVGGYGTKELPEEYTPFLFRTFRFIRVRVTTKDQGMSLVGYRYLSTGYPLEVKTHLKTSDETMNRIWEISVRTLKRCMHETYVDCPFYEQLQYTMDSRAEILFTYMLSADDRLARQCMDAFRRSQRSDGILCASAPAVGVNVIPGFSIFYILMVHDHMMYFGDQGLVREHFGCVDRVLEFFDRNLTEKGLVGKVGGPLMRDRYWSFIDWCEEWNQTIGVPHATELGDGSLTMESLLYLYGLRAAAELASYIGRESVAEEYRLRAEKLHVAILRHCVGENGLIQDGPGVEEYSTHCQVWAVLNDLQSVEQGRKNLERTFGAGGIPQCSVSMSFYLLQAFEKTGRMEDAGKMWDPWREMLRNHLTTCVENDTDQRSDCHAWGSLILYALPAVYLGIRPVSPGFAKYRQKTNLGHLSWIRGEICTPRGMLSVDTGVYHS